jgi:hypothetical protein
VRCVGGEEGAGRVERVDYEQDFLLRSCCSSSSGGCRRIVRYNLGAKCVDGFAPGPDEYVYFCGLAQRRKGDVYDLGSRDL